MPNTFGTKTASVQLCDPRDERINRARFGRQAIPELSIANSVYVPRGRQRARAFVLLVNSEYRSIAGNGYAGTFQLSFDDFITPLTFYGLYVVQARCVSTGLDDDPNSLYLVELTDARGVLSNPWFAAPTNSYYNVLAPAYPQGYYSQSCASGSITNATNASPIVITSTAHGLATGNLVNIAGVMGNTAANSTWVITVIDVDTFSLQSSTGNGAYVDGGFWTSPLSWSQMIEDLWTQMPLLGPFPGLPSTPSWYPTNWNLAGTSSWDALCDALDHIGMSVACDLTSQTPYAIVSAGADDDDFDAEVADAGLPQDDLQWIDTGSGRVPGSVVVYFRVIYQYFGTEETVRQDANQWATSAVYSVTVTAPGEFASSQGVGYIWDDFCVRYDVDGTVLPGDASAATAIAAERVGQYFNLIYDDTLGFMDTTYAGLVGFTAGSQVDGVAWKMDFRTGRAGWVTNIIRGKLWPELYGDSTLPAAMRYRRP